MPIDEADFQFRGIRDPRLAPYATSSLPAWLWANDGSRILWANAAGAAVFGADDLGALAARRFGPPDRHRRQIARLAGRLALDGSVRLDRLRGFGARLNGLVTCGCRRLVFGKGDIGVLVVAAAQPGRPLPLKLRLQRLVASFDTAAAAFDAEGFRLAANAAAEDWLMDTASGGGTLAALGLAETAAVALHEGGAEIPLDHGRRLLLRRIGSGADTALLLIGQTQMKAAELPEPTPAPPPGDSAAKLSEAAAAAPMTEPATAPVPPSPEAAVAAEAPPEPAPGGLLTAEMAATATFVPSTGPAPDEPEPVAAPATAASPVDAAAAEPAPAQRHHPLRFLWQMDADERFSLGSDEFAQLIGPSTSAAFGRPWTEIVEECGIDPEDRVAAAVATRATWSGITVHWPVDGTETALEVELSGLPVFDRDRNFLGYRGFGVCRDIEALNRLAEQRRNDAAALEARSDTPTETKARPAMADTPPPASPPETDHPVDTSPNVVPFRPSADAKAPTLSPGENNAFNELARQLAARLEAERDALDQRDGELAESSASTAAPGDAIEAPGEADAAAAVSSTPEPLPAAAPRTGTSAARETALFDLLPVGVLIYRLDRLLHANRVFLDRVGYADLEALAGAGGLDALDVKHGAGGEGAGSDGTPVRIESPGQSRDDGAAIDARLHDIVWDGEAAHVLILALAAPQETAAPTVPAAVAPTADASDQQRGELAAILEASDDGILILAEDGRIASSNRGAETIFGRSGDDLAGRPFTDLFAGANRDELAAALGGGGDGRPPARHEVLGLGPDGQPLDLTVKLGRAPGGHRFAIVRPRPAAAQAAPDDSASRRIAERTAAARADILARLSHELRAPLNAIIGFADVMIEERFGAIGNERYGAYLKDMRAAGERVLGILGDFLDLSRAETGKLDLAFTGQDLNDVVEKCVTIMQPQANRERIIIRTALSHALPQVTADADALRQIVLNLVGNSIHVARAGGQVIVSTAVSEFGDVVLRVRDTGRGLNHAEMTEAIEQFRQTDGDQLAQDNAGINLSLTKALVEANRAQFHIRSAPQSGTLVEVAFPPEAKAG